MAIIVWSTAYHCEVMLRNVVCYNVEKLVLPQTWTKGGLTKAHIHTIRVLRITCSCCRWNLMEEERKINRLLRDDPENDKLNDRLQQVTKSVVP